MSGTPRNPNAGCLPRDAGAETAARPEGAGNWKILENLPVPVLVATLHKRNPRVVFLNSQFTATFGYTLEDIPTKAEWGRLAYPDVVYRRGVFAKWDEAVARAVAGRGSVEAMEFRVAAKDGRVVDVVFNASVYGDVLQVTLTDITARREAERELQSARDRLEQTAYAVTENIPVGTVALHIDAEGVRRYVFTSNRWLAMLDLEREAVMANHGLSIERIHPEDRAGFEEASRRRSLEEGRFYWEGRLLVGGRVSWVTIESVGESLGNGESLWWGIMTDITARREAERELRSARELLGQAAYDLTTNIPVGTYVLKFDDSGMPHFVFLSERWLEMLDLRRDEVHADPSLAFNMVHPDEREAFEKHNAEVFAEKKPFFWEGRIVVRGQTRWVTIESIPRDLPEGGTVWEGVMIDITRRKTAELELEELRERERQNEARQRAELERKLRSSLAAAAAAHEINQPLGRILLTSQLVLENQRARATGDPKLSGFLRELANEAESVVSTIEKMKSLMRNTGTQSEPLDLRGIVDSAILYAGPFARAGGVEIPFQRPARAVRLHGDADQLQIALNNLIRNAIESLETAAQPHPRVVLLGLRRTGGRIELSVEDNGPGLSFARVGDTLFKSTKRNGSGLGLFIVQTTMENHGGELKIGKSKLGGAKIRLVFPVGSGS